MAGAPENRVPDPLAPLGDWLAERMPAVKNALLSPAVGKAAGSAVAGDAGGAVGEALYGAIGSQTSQGAGVGPEPTAVGASAEPVRLSAPWAVRLPDGAIALFEAGTQFTLLRDANIAVTYRWGNVFGTELERYLRGGRGG